jgi:hypothetical protein
MSAFIDYWLYYVQYNYFLFLHIIYSIILMLVRYFCKRPFIQSEEHNKQQIPPNYFYFTAIVPFHHQRNFINLLCNLLLFFTYNSMALILINEYINEYNAGNYKHKSLAAVGARAEQNYYIGLYSVAGYCMILLFSLLHSIILSPFTMYDIYDKQLNKNKITKFHRDLLGILYFIGVFELVTLVAVIYGFYLLEKSAAIYLLGYAATETLRILNAFEITIKICTAAKRRKPSAKEIAGKKNNTAISGNNSITDNIGSKVEEESAENKESEQHKERLNDLHKLLGELTENESKSRSRKEK